jgi:hypothetical protein
MSNYHVEPAEKPQALTPQALRSLRQDPVQGISRRTLLRRSIGGATLLWLTEVAAGSIGFLWPNQKGGFGGTIEIGTIDDIKAQNASLPFESGFPVYYWLECPCHGSRYDRLGIKADGAQYGPAPRGMDRFSISVDADGVLTLDTSKITLGPLPIAVGQPGIIPPKSPVGCI